jgi:hypothetical protein
MKYRHHRGGFAESMETTVEIDSLTELAAHINASLDFKISENDICIEAYGGVDRRNGWDTHVVEIRWNTGEWYPIGFTNGKLAPIIQPELINA